MGVSAISWSSWGASSRRVVEASQMSPKFYQDMIDRGWRRSGDYMYHPDMARTCCPQYTIRLDSLDFRPNKKHRQVMNRFNRFLSTGEKPGEGSELKGKGKGKESNDWLDTLRAHQVYHGEDKKEKHRFETILTPAKATPETFELYKRYQVAVHKDKPAQVSLRGFSRFLCDSPIGNQPIQYQGSRPPNLPEHYGSYHLLYKIDDELVGISVIDILPSCVSSVYFIWHPDWAWASLGKLSAMHEIALGVDMNRAGVEGMNYLYMGYWISNCIKMRYKSEYSPSYLLDPGTNHFYPLTPNLDRYLQAHPTGYHPFANIPSDWKQTNELDDVPMNDQADTDDDEDEDVEEIDEFPCTPPPPGFVDPASFREEDVDALLVLMKGGLGRKSRLVPISVNVYFLIIGAGTELMKQALDFVNPTAVTKQVREMLAAVSMDMMASGASLGKMRDKGILFFG